LIVFWINLHEWVACLHILVVLDVHRSHVARNPRAYRIEVDIDLRIVRRLEACEVVPQESPLIVFSADIICDSNFPSTLQRAQ
jgi:hypothetical protein